MRLERLVIGGIIALALTLVIGGVWLAIKSDNEWAQHCAEIGGYVVKDTDTSTGTGTVVSANGKVGTGTVTTTTTDYYCFDREDGRTLDIR